MSVSPIGPEPSPTRDGQLDLTRFATDQAPPATTRGRRGIWLERFGDLIDQVPGLWVNATKAWGTKKAAAASIRKTAERAELAVEVRVSRDELWIKVR